MKFSSVSDLETGGPPEQASPAQPILVRHDLRQGPRVQVASWKGLWASIRPSIHFFLQTEVHVYSFAVAANVLLTFFPFLVAMIIICRSVLHWNAAVQVILHMVDSYFPQGFGVDFHGALMYAATRRKFSWLSVFLLLFTSNGIFVPLEVAFNRIWHVKRNRSFLRNQVISLGLIFGCGALVLLSTSLATLNVQFVKDFFGTAPFLAWLQLAALRIAALPVIMLIIFLLYWLLPNARIDVKRLIPASIVTGLLLETSTYVNLITWPWLRAKLMAEVPPFVQSVSILLWSFIATMILMAGAEWSSRVSVDALSGADV